MNLMTIGFTRTSAERFFGRLVDAGVRRVIDVRLKPRSQLAGFAKSGDLEFFLRAVSDIDYVHEPLLAPTPDILDAYRKKRIDWPSYEREFIRLMKHREIEARLDPTLYDGGCLLCSEAEPQHCHRRLVAEYLGREWAGPMQIHHL
jgi:uncharacterized protein (DUF488 family)